MFDLVLGTNNAKKLVELRLLLPEDKVQLTSLAEIPESIEVDETGDTFQANAALKATEQAKHLGRWVLAEDSGLTVDALKGAPGVISARYAGVHGEDEANNDKLLKCPFKNILHRPLPIVQIIMETCEQGVYKNRRRGVNVASYCHNFVVYPWQRLCVSCSQFTKQSTKIHSFSLSKRYY